MIEKLNGLYVATLNGRVIKQSDSWLACWNAIGRECLRGGK